MKHNILPLPHCLQFWQFASKWPLWLPEIPFSMISQVVMQRGHSNLLTSTFSSLSPAIISSLGLFGIGSTILYSSPNITKLFHIQRALLVQIISLFKHAPTFTFSADITHIAENALIQTQCCLPETQEIGHFILMLFIGPRCPWGPIYGSWCPTVRPSPQHHLQT